jgi:cyclic beta-1,2-glucan synthetase
VLSETADPEHAARAMAALDRHLIRHDDGLALLFTPPFDTTPRDPGYIKGYPPGLRENGGQYSHAAMWAIMAFAKLGEGACAVDLFSLANPINHARTLDEVERYKVEPYVVAADVYSVSPHTGRGGWTWYTGSAAWMYRAGVESILGIRREGAFLVVAPCIPSAWPGFEAAVNVASTHYDIRVRNLPGAGRNVVQADLDGEPVGRTEGVVHVPLDGKKHVLAIILGADRSDL